MWRSKDKKQTNKQETAVVLKFMANLSHVIYHLHLRIHRLWCFMKLTDFVKI